LQIADQGRPSDGADIADHESVGPGRCPSQVNGRPDDFLQLGVETVPSEAARVGLKGVREQALGACAHIRLVKGSDPVWVRQVPKLPALAVAQTGALQFRAHGAIHEQDAAGVQGFQEA
jgi:hypothetical protein